MTIRRQGGIALLEALLAAVILAIGLLGTIGLQARSYSALSEAGMRAEATIAVNQLLGMMNTDLANLDDYAVAKGAQPDEKLATWLEDTRARIPGAEVTVTLARAGGTTRTAVTIAIGWQRSAASQRNTHRVTAYLAEST